MRVLPDGTFVGLRRSHGCLAACGLQKGSSTVERRHIALHPVIDYRPYIMGSPDVFPPGHPGYDQGVAADLEIPMSLRLDIEAWIVQWKENFLHRADRPVDQPVWRAGFDEMAWLDRGHALAERLQKHYPDHLVFCCAEKLVVCELAADQLDYVCLLSGEVTRARGWRMQTDPPGPETMAHLRLSPEYGVTWGLWAKRLPYYQPPCLQGPMGFPTPQSLGLSDELEERLWAWNDDWRRGFVGGTGPDDVGAHWGLRGYGYGLPRWSEGVDPTAWHREGREIACRLADELPGVQIHIGLGHYVCSRQFRKVSGLGDDVFFSPAAAGGPATDGGVDGSRS